MLEFLAKIFSREQSKDVAKERLRLVLVHDRSTLSPQVLDEIKEELIQVISQHMEIDEGGIEVELSGEEDSVALVASIPILEVPRERIPRS